MIMVSRVIFPTTEALSPNPRKHTPMTGTSQPIFGRHSEGFQIQSQVVEHTWHESKQNKRKQNKKTNLTYASSKRMSCWGLL